MTKTIQLDDLYQEHLKALKSYEATSTSTEAVRLAVREALQRRGLWPTQQSEVVVHTTQESESPA